MSENYNPAARLYPILKNAKSVGIRTNGRAIDVWAEVLDVDGKDPEQLFHAMGSLAALVTELDRSLESIEPTGKRLLYARELPKLKSALSPQRLNNAWQETDKYLNNELPLSLEFCHQQLTDLNGERKIDSTTLGELQKQIEELLDSLVDSELDINLREFLVDNLNGIRDAILQYRLRGASSLKEALERTTGALVINQHEIEQAKDSPEVSRFAKIFRTLSEMVNVVYRLKELVETATKLLPPA